MTNSPKNLLQTQHDRSKGKLPYIWIGNHEKCFWCVPDGQVRRLKQLLNTYFPMLLWLFALTVSSTVIAQPTLTYVDSGVSKVQTYMDVSTKPLLRREYLDKQDIASQLTTQMVVQESVYFPGLSPSALHTIYIFDRYFWSNGDPMDFWYCVRGYTVRQFGTSGATNFFKSHNGEPLLEKSSLPVNCGRYEERIGKMRRVITQRATVCYQNRTDSEARWYLSYKPPGLMWKTPWVHFTNSVPPFDVLYFTPRPQDGWKYLRLISADGPEFHQP